MNSAMQGQSLTLAKQEFASLLSKLDPDVSKHLLDWITEQHHNCICGDETKEGMQVALPNAFQQCVHAEENLQLIIQDIRTKLPLSGVCDSESMMTPETGQNSDCDSATTVVIDAFLYDDDDVDKLCDENKLSRNYCHNCGSHNTTPLTFISHSMSVLQIKFIFEAILPKLITNFSGTTLVDVGSRLGAVLYGAYFFSPFEKIIGVEMNNELCCIQMEMINKYQLGNRVQIINNDVCDTGKVLQEADAILLNNTFEFFLPKETQISTWLNIREHICKRGCIVITVPSVEESVCLGDDELPILNVQEWLVPLNIDLKQIGLDYISDDDLEEVGKISFYKVK